MCAAGFSSAPVSNWNLLASVTSAVIDASPGDGQFIIRYRMTHDGTCGILLPRDIFWATVTRTEGSIPAASNLASMVWGWLFGINYLITRLPHDLHLSQGGTANGVRRDERVRTADCVVRGIGVLLCFDGLLGASHLAFRLPSLIVCASPGAKSRDISVSMGSGARTSVEVIDRGASDDVQQASKKDCGRRVGLLRRGLCRPAPRASSARGRGESRNAQRAGPGTVSSQPVHGTAAASQPDPRLKSLQELVAFQEHEGH